jgi:hypothetical protein
MAGTANLFKANDLVKRGGGIRSSERAIHGQATEKL